jgi:hypothetical protein
MRLFCQCNAMHRRDVVCGGGAAVFSAIIATLMGSSKPVKAEAISGSVPELDGVAVRVVVDSYQFAVAPSRKLADVDIQHFGWGLGGNKPPSESDSLMGRATQRRELATLESEQTDVLAFADRCREIEGIPESLESGNTKRRKRGNRTDRDCVDEIFDLVSQGITATAAVRYVGVPWATWQKWLRLNHERAREQFDFA